MLRAGFRKNNGTDGWLERLEYVLQSPTENAAEHWGQDPPILLLDPFDLKQDNPLPFGGQKQLDREGHESHGSFPIVIFTSPAAEVRRASFVLARMIRPDS